MKKGVNLGDRAADRVTGFKGIATARTEWLHGCVRITLQPESLDKDGKPKESQTFDEPQLNILKRAAVAGAVTPGATRDYGPRDDRLALRRQ